MLAAAAGASNLLGLAFTVVIARQLGTEDYGSLAALVSAFLVVSIAGSALQITVARETSLEVEHHDGGIVHNVESWVMNLLVVAAVAVVVGLLLRRPIGELIGVGPHPWAAAAIFVSGAAWILLSVLRGVLQGVGRFGWVAVSIAGEAGLRLIFAVGFVAAGGGVTGGFLGSGAAVVTMAAILAYPIAQSLKSLAADDSASRAPSGADHSLAALALRSWPALTALTLIALLQNSDVIMVKRDAADAIAGAYAANSVAAKVIVWVAIGLGLWVVPETARRGPGRESLAVLFRVLGLLAAIGVVMVTAYALMGRELLDIGFGDKFDLAAGSLATLAAAMTLLSMTYVVAQHFLGIGRRLFLVLLATAALSQIVTLTAVSDSPARTADTLLVVNSVLFVLMLLLALRQSRSSAA
jgi:O-antigen/teichoic acid export membrane protein